MYMYVCVYVKMYIKVIESILVIKKPPHIENT